MGKSKIEREVKPNTRIAKDKRRKEDLGDGGASTGKYPINPIETRKDKIKQPDASARDIIPRLTSNCLFVGASGSGKTTLLGNLVLEKDYWAGWFDKIYIISPTAKTDDIQREIGDIIEDKDEQIIDDMSIAADKIQELMDEQRELIEAEGAHKAPQILLIYDDVVAEKDLLNADQFGKSFIMSRHFNFTTCLCTQSFTQAPRKCRLQCQNLFYFKGGNSEMELLAEELAPPGFTKKRMQLLISFCTQDKYTFMHVNRRVPFEHRYRRNLGDVVVLESVPEP